MYLDKIHRFRTGVSLAIDTSLLRTLIEDAVAGDGSFELEQIKRPGDLYAYLSVTVHEGAEGLVKRRSKWAGKIRRALLARKPVSYGNFANLFWRNLDDEDPDGDEWYRLIAGKGFDAELVGLLDKVRSARRSLHQQRTNVPAGRNWGSLGRGDAWADRAAF